jgi:phage shock protein PspC (stress-responsive transcriptional regulator)
MEEKNLHNELFGDQPEIAVPELAIRRFQRSGDNVIIAGVCAGIAEYSGKEPATVRLIAMLSLLLGAWMVVTYLIVALLLPIGKHDDSISENEIDEINRDNFRTVLSGLLIVIGFHFAFVELGIFTSSRLMLLPNSYMFPLATVAVGVFLLTNKIPRLNANYIYKNEFYRTQNDKYLLGVCGGIANYLNIDSLPLRIIFLLLTGLTLGLFGIVYIIIAFTTKQKSNMPFTNE